MPTRQFSWYDAVCGGFADEVNVTIPAEAFGEEIGQNSSLTADEHRTSSLGSGPTPPRRAGGGERVRRPRLFHGARDGLSRDRCRPHDEAVAAADAAATAHGLADRACFLRADGRQPCPSATVAPMRSSASDSINHRYELERQVVK
jgi:hypothetical protein